MLAQRAAEAALRDVRHAGRSLRFMERERARMTEDARSVAGLYSVSFRGEFYPDGITGRAEGDRDGGRTSSSRHFDRDCSQVPGLNVRSVRGGSANEG